MQVPRDGLQNHGQNLLDTVSGWPQGASGECSSEPLVRPVSWLV